MTRRAIPATAAFLSIACGSPEQRDTGASVAPAHEVVRIRDGDSVQLDMTGWSRWTVSACAEHYDEGTGAYMTVCGGVSSQYVTRDGVLCGPQPFDPWTYVYHGDQPITLASCTIRPEGYSLHVTRWAE